MESSQRGSSFPLRDSFGREETVERWMTPNPHSVTPRQTLKEAAEILVRHRIDGLPVVDDQQRVVGLITKSQLLKCFADGSSPQRKIGEVMTASVVAVTARSTLSAAYRIPVGRLPVVDERKRLVGILTRSDILRAYANELTRFRKAEYLPETLATELDSSYDGIVVCDAEGIIGEINRVSMQELSRQVRKKEVLPKPSSHQRKPRAFAQIIGQSEAIASVKRLARKAANSLASVLITGESGTGKELFAKAIHFASKRGDGPFLTVNCAAIPEQLLEAELFGYEEGAFTGARKGGKPGKIELADKGTLFLDEIGDMPLAMQAKMLRVLQEREVERLGGVSGRAVDVRIIAATNRPLEELVEKGLFREDLYYRLHVIHLHIPPLRARKQDIPLLLSYYLEVYGKKYGVPMKHFTPEALQMLLRYDWPGNIRELINLVEMLISLVEKPEVCPDDLPGRFKEKEARMANVSPLKTHAKEDSRPVALFSEIKGLSKIKEKEAILQALAAVNGNKSAAAKKLGIHRSTLYEKLKNYGIT